MSRVLLLCLIGASSCGVQVTPGDSTTTTFCCSINGRSYDCPDQSSVEQCANLDNPDPSRCTRRTSSCR